MLPQEHRLKYSFVLQSRERYLVRRMCRVFVVFHNDYYDLFSGSPSRLAIENGRLLQLFHASHEASGKIYGAPRVWLILGEVGDKVSLNSCRLIK